jgi:NodT family efflux transporter outer membrane factor (OMF) lipoprotein
MQDVVQATLGPQVTGRASLSEQKLSYNYLTPRYMTPDGWNDYGLVAIDLDWDLDLWGKNSSALKAAVSQHEAMQAELAHARLLLTTTIAQHYIELSKLYSVRELILQSSEIRKKTLGLSADRHTSGLDDKVLSSQARGRLSATLAELQEYDEQISILKNRISALVGAGPDRALRIQKPSLKIAATGLPSEIQLNLLGRRPDVSAARLLVQAQKHSVEQHKAEFYPNVNLTALIGVQSLGLSKLTRDGSSLGGIGPAISLPIFTAGRLEGALRSSFAAYEEAVARYNQVVTTALEEVADAGVSQKALTAQIEKVRDVVHASEGTLRVVRDRYQAGLTNYIEVLNSEDELLSNKKYLQILEARSFSIDVSLKYALGGGYQQN